MTAKIKPLNWIKISETHWQAHTAIGDFDIYKVPKNLNSGYEYQGVSPTYFISLQGNDPESMIEIFNEEWFSRISKLLEE